MADSRTRRGLWLATALLSALALTACSSPSTLPEPDYFELVRERDAFSNLEDETIRGLGSDVCDAIRDAGYVEVLDTFIDSGMKAGDAGAFIAFSVSQYCPNHLDKIPNT